MAMEEKKTSFYIVGKDAVVAAIKNSQKELRMLGTTAIELPWQANYCELYDLLYTKYTQGVYEISIVAESDPTTTDQAFRLLLLLKLGITQLKN